MMSNSSLNSINYHQASLRRRRRECSLHYSKKKLYNLTVEAIDLKKIFGTDGVRGVAISELTVELAMKIGKAAACLFAPNGGKILIGKDTRISSSSLEAAIAAGITSCGADAVLLGVLPTPAVAFLTKISSSNAGIVISASHNSFEFNGIKIFNNQGFKISSIEQDTIENLISNDFKNISVCKPESIGTIRKDKYFISKYVKYLKSLLRSVNLKVAFDFANGAASYCALKVFGEMVNCEFLNSVPDGININKNCGSTNLSFLSHHVVKNGFDLGIAFDGDADRCLAVDKNGEIIDGDHIIAALALEMQKNSELEPNIVVGTMMSNMGFENFLKDNKINFIRAKIGDRFVAEEMKKSGALIGGEQSGHIIFSKYSTTGDAILTAIMLINLISETRDSSGISNLFKPYPQFIKNIKISKENNLLESDDFKNCIKNIENILASSGRIFCRESGTEPLIRVMCESSSANDLEKAEKELEKFISSL